MLLSYGIDKVDQFFDSQGHCHANKEDVQLWLLLWILYKHYKYNVYWSWWWWWRILFFETSCSLSWHGISLILRILSHTQQINISQSLKFCWLKNGSTACLVAHNNHQVAWFDNVYLYVQLWLTFTKWNCLPVVAFYSQTQYSWILVLFLKKIFIYITAKKKKYNGKYRAKINCTEDPE